MSSEKRKREKREIEDLNSNFAFADLLSSDGRPGGWLAEDLRRDSSGLREVKKTERARDRKTFFWV